MLKMIDNLIEDEVYYGQITKEKVIFTAFSFKLQQEWFYLLLVKLFNKLHLLFTRTISSVIYNQTKHCIFQISLIFKLVYPYPMFFCFAK